VITLSASITATDNPASFKRKAEVIPTIPPPIIATSTRMSPGRAG